MGKVFYLTVMLWANTTAEKMRYLLSMYGGHDEKAWVSGVDSEMIFTLAPIVFGSIHEALKVFRRPPESSGKDQGQTVGDLLEKDNPTWGPIGQLKRAEIRGRILITLREERGLYGTPVTMSDPPTVGFTHLSDNRGGEHHPALIWVIDDIEPARVKLTVQCWIVHYKALEYLEDVLKPLTEDFSTATLKIIPPGDLDDMPEDLRARYRKTIQTLYYSLGFPDASTRYFESRTPQPLPSPFAMPWGEDAPQPGAPIEPARSTPQEGPPAIPQPIELDARRLADIERRLLKGRIFKEKHPHTRRGPEDVRVIMRRAADTNTRPNPSVQPAPAEVAPADDDIERILAQAYKMRQEPGMNGEDLAYARLRFLWPYEAIPKSQIARVIGCASKWVDRKRKELGLPQRKPGRKRGQ